MCVPTAVAAVSRSFHYKHLKNNTMSLSTANRRRHPPCWSLTLFQMIFLNIQVKYIIPVFYH